MSKVSDIVHNRELFVVSPNATVAQVLDVLGQNQIFSVPIVGKKGRCKGFVDWLDILTYLTQVSSEEKQSRVSPPSRALTSDDVSTLLERAQEFSLRSIREKHLANKGGHDPLFKLSADATIDEAFQVLQRNHHAAIVQNKVLINVISQMDLVRYLVADSQRAGVKGRQTVRGLKLHRKRVYVVRSDDLAIDAFYGLWARGFTGAGVVDGEGKLVGNLSAADLKDLGDFNFSLLLKPVKEWIADEQPVVVHEFDALNDVMQKMLASRVHRVYVVGPGGYPQGVITTSDIVGVFAKEQKEKKKKKK